MIGLSSAPIVALLVFAALPAHADSRRQAEWWLSKLHVTQAWRGGQGAGVTVAVLADGVDASQPDLTGRVVAGPDFTRSGRIAGGPHYGVIGTGLASLIRSEEHTSELQSPVHLVCRLLLEMASDPGADRKSVV